MATCKYCDNFHGTVVRIFDSEEAYRASGMASGEDGLEDEHASKAVWPGKSNVGRSASNWWVCCPVHPNCGDEFMDWSPAAQEQEQIDWFADMPEEEYDKYVTNPGIS